MAWANWDVKEWDKLMILNRNQGMHILLREMQMIALKFTLWANLTNLIIKYSSVQYQLKTYIYH
jgi:hypothetical protein